MGVKHAVYKVKERAENVSSIACLCDGLLNGPRLTGWKCHKGQPSSFTNSVKQFYCMLNLHKKGKLC